MDTTDKYHFNKECALDSYAMFYDNNASIQTANAIYVDKIDSFSQKNIIYRNNYFERDVKLKKQISLLSTNGLASGVTIENNTFKTHYDDDNSATLLSLGSIEGLTIKNNVFETASRKILSYSWATGVIENNVGLQNIGDDDTTSSLNYLGYIKGVHSLKQNFITPREIYSEQVNYMRPLAYKMYKGPIPQGLILPPFISDGIFDVQSRNRQNMYWDKTFTLIPLVNENNKSLISLS